MAVEPDPFDVADRIHSAAIRLLRHVRKADLAAGISAPQLSALSVLVFNGPQTMTQLAFAEQVRLPTMSKLVADLESRELVVRSTDPADRRVSRVFPTRKGRSLLEESRKRRLARLVGRLDVSPSLNWSRWRRQLTPYSWLRSAGSLKRNR